MNLPKCIFAFAGVVLLSACLLGWGAVPASAQATGSISGRVTDSSGAGIGGIQIQVYDDEHLWNENVFSDSNGDYFVIGLEPGNYKIFFHNYGKNYLREWYNNKNSFKEADPIYVTEGLATININAQLATGGQISGKVMDGSGNGIGGIDITVNFSNLQYSTTVKSNPEGLFSVPGLPTGMYEVGFVNPFYVQEWYNDKISRESADLVSVTAGSTTQNINAYLSKKMTIEISKTKLYFGATQNGTVTPAESSTISNSGAGIMNWTATSSDDWLSITPASGMGDGILSIGIVRTDMAAGLYMGSVYVSDPNAVNSPQFIGVKYQIYAPGTDSVPFGSFDTPIDESTVASSIPITGWALDDIGVESIKIYRGTDIFDRIYIGDATFVEGARPDVAALYPNYPQYSRAGWGYMLLTNMLPNSGNGTFQLLAYATDVSGHEVLLGTKTITCDNANAVKPFGAIDTPAQGGTASGNAYINFGWALTPMPNSIPTDGSTITVWVDGLPLGHPVYNNYRDDIAALFPGYANSNGAVGYFSLDTTGYSDGVHTIAWSVSDSAGNIDGIGSRYFTILNAAGGTGSAAKLSDTASAELTRENDVQNIGRRRTGRNTPSSLMNRTLAEVLTLSEDLEAPVFIRRGMLGAARGEMVLPDSDGVTRIAIPEVGRLSLYLNEKDAGETEAQMNERGKRMMSRAAQNSEGRDVSRESAGSLVRYEAYELVGEELRSLPIGASFDSYDGILYWQPGPGFIGEYTIIFIKNDATAPVRKLIKVSIVSR